MINVKHLSEERPLNLSAAAAHIGRLTGEKPHISTIWRWCSKGSKGVRLESICIGGKRYVTVSAIERFITAATAARSGEPPPSASPPQTRPPDSPEHGKRRTDQRRDEIDAVRRRLDEITGVCGRPAPPNRSA